MASPKINYSNVPTILNVNIPVTPIVPVNTGGEPMTKTAISTVAGVMTPSLYMQNHYYNNGNPATFFFPLAIAATADGTTYVFEDSVPAMRKINTVGFTSEFAGSSVWINGSYTGYGYADGDATTARFNNSRGLATDANGNIYVADTLNRRIRKVTPTGVTTTVAGSGITGSIDGTVTTAQFKCPNALCVDNTGNIYVADEHKVRKIDTLGNVTTVTGSTAGNSAGTLATAKFKRIEGITTDNLGNIYVSDSGNALVKKINLNDGTVKTLDVSVTEGGNLYSLREPAGIVYSNGSVFVSDSAGNMIFRINSLGVVSRYAGNGIGKYKDGVSTTTNLGASLYIPTGLSADAEGNLYIADKGSNRIRKVVATANAYSIYPKLPNGLKLNSLNGEITGTPTQAIPPTIYVVTASNYEGASTAQFTLQVV